MADEDLVLKEVDQELAEDRQWAMFRKYGPAIIGSAVAIVVAVGGWQFWNVSQDQRSKAQALEFKNAIEQLEETPEIARQSLEAISEENASGYGVLAQFQRAASFARDGDRLEAIAGYVSIYESNATPKRLRELARLRASYLSLVEGRDAVLGHLGALADTQNPFYFHASEISGLAALQAKDYETALATFSRLSDDVSTPEPVRVRAEDFAALALSGKSGVNIAGDIRVEDLLNAIDGGDDHAGHDHEGDHDHDEAEAESEALLESILTDGAVEAEEAIDEENALEILSENPAEETPATNSGNE